MKLNLTNPLPLKSNSLEIGGIEPEKQSGSILDEHGEHWEHTCPNCQAEYESTGCFDSSLIHTLVLD